MKKTIITAFKFKNNCYEVEVVEQTSYGNFPIYKKAVKGLILSNQEINNFVKKTKKDIETLIQGQLTEIVCLIDKNHQLANLETKHLKIANVSNYSDFAIIKKYYNQNKLVIKINTIKKSSDYFYKSITTISNQYASNIKDIMMQNNLNVVDFYDLDQMQDVFYLTKTNNRVATFVNLEANCLNISFYKNKINVLNKKFALGLNRILNLNTKMFDLATAKTHLSYVIGQLINEEAKNYLIDSNEMCVILNHNAQKFIKTDILSKYCDATLNKANSILVSNEMEGLMFELNQEKYNVINRTKITTEIFVIDSQMLNHKNLFI